LEAEEAEKEEDIEEGGKKRRTYPPEQKFEAEEAEKEDDITPPRLSKKKWRKL